MPMPKTETAPRVTRRYRLLTRWCSTCIAASPRRITEQSEPDEIDRRFWKNHIAFVSVCPGCGNEVKDFFTADEIKNMELVGILKR